MHQKLSNREIEDENDVSMLPMMESGDQKQKASSIFFKNPLKLKKIIILSQIIKKMQN